jgi:hypothetical protein
MTSRTTAGFWECFDRLPADVQKLARSRYRLWQRDPFHPSLHFKEIVPGLWSARINVQYRTLARRRGDVVAWFWIGTHNDYNHLIARL